MGLLRPGVLTQIPWPVAEWGRLLAKQRLGKVFPLDTPRLRNPPPPPTASAGPVPEGAGHSPRIPVGQKLASTTEQTDSLVSRFDRGKNEEGWGGKNRGLAVPIAKAAKSERLKISISTLGSSILCFLPGALFTDIFLSTTYKAFSHMPDKMSHQDTTCLPSGITLFSLPDP